MKMKKKRFGIKKISKEENLRLGVRKEERLEIARAKENLWRHHRGSKDRDLEEEEILEKEMENGSRKRTELRGCPKSKSE